MNEMSKCVSRSINCRKVALSSSCYMMSVSFIIDIDACSNGSATDNKRGFCLLLVLRTKVLDRDNKQTTWWLISAVPANKREPFRPSRQDETELEQRCLTVDFGPVKPSLLSNQHRSTGQTRQKGGWRNIKNYPWLKRFLLVSKLYYSLTPIPHFITGHKSPPVLMLEAKTQRSPFVSRRQLNHHDPCFHESLLAFSFHSNDRISKTPSDWLIKSRM